MPVPDPSPLADIYSPAVLGLWGESDEAATKKWMDEKVADFEAEVASSGVIAGHWVRRQAGGSPCRGQGQRPGQG